MKYVGIDFHKNYSFVTEMNEGGAIQRQVKLSNHYDTLKGYVDTLPSQTKIAIEATCNWYYFYELVEDHDLEVALAHPLKTKAIASARLMNDKVSSETLAHLLRADLLPRAYIPDQETRDIREVLRMHAFLIAQRTRLKNRVHAILLKNGISCPYANIFGKTSLTWLNELTLRACYQNAIVSYTRLAKAFNEEITLLKETIKTIAYDHPYARILDTHPGISYYSGLLIAAEIGEIKRFPNAGKLCSYAGLVPTMHASGGKVRMGSITKQGSKWLRWILVECTLHAIKKSDHYRDLYTRVAHKHGNGTARVAVARSMLRAIYAMLRFNRPYQERQLRPAPWGHNLNKGSEI
ncbi:MAG: IS110 family transposase [Anaerolineales bacterium]